MLSLVALYARFTAASPVALAPSVGPLQGSAPSPIRSSGAAEPATPPSPELERLQARRVLYETVDALIEAADFARARQLLDDDQARYGDDLAPPWRDLEQGYRLIADCLERPLDPKPRMRAGAFVQISEPSGLVPRIRVACGK
jgi:hypothetical protein